MTDDLSTQTDIRPGTYRIDPARSEARFTATHAFGLKPVHGTVAVTAGTVTVAAEPRRSTVSAEIDATTWTTEDPRRDRDIKGKRFLNVADHPTIGFRSTRVTGGAGWQITGILSVRGGSTEVTLDLTGTTPTVDGYRLTATTTVDRFAAGVTAGRGLIGRTVQIALALCVTAA
jgi:polyisoprenoid-binding protein YceI